MNNKQKILIVDDAEMNRTILTGIMGEAYDFLEATNGVEALELLNEHRDIDLMLLDIVMPELDGFGVLTAMKQRQWLDEIPVIVISAENTSSFIKRAYDLGVVDYINRPFDAAVVQRRVQNTLILYAKQKQLMQLVEQQIFEREKSSDIMINILSHVVEFRNRESGSHTLHIRVITDILLRELERRTNRYHLSESDISMIATASALHDIGKISIPDAILNKPGSLTPEEWELMKTHTTVGDALLQDVPVRQDEPLMKAAHEICRWHHERWDGRGYPDGLSGDEIPISAQVVSVADVYDALTSERCYKRAFDHETALRMIFHGECGTFNPLLMECLSAAAGRLQSTLRRNAEQYNYWDTAQRLTEELLK